MKERIQGSVRFEEEQKDKTNGYAVQKCWEEENTLECIFANDVKTENGGKIQRKRHLHESSEEIVQADLKYGKIVGVREYRLVIVETDICHMLAESIPVCEAVFKHIDYRQIGKG
ncbi:hypothetical protein D3C81_442870 [compost metagenome]